VLPGDGPPKPRRVLEILAGVALLLVAVVVARARLGPYPL
jgi:hypothetical protein